MKRAHDTDSDDSPPPKPPPPPPPTPHGHVPDAARLCQSSRHRMRRHAPPPIDTSHAGVINRAPSGAEGDETWTPDRYPQAMQETSHTTTTATTTTTMGVDAPEGPFVAPPQPTTSPARPALTPRTPPSQIRRSDIPPCTPRTPRSAFMQRDAAAWAWATRTEGGVPLPPAFSRDRSASPSPRSRSSTTRGRGAPPGPIEPAPLQWSPLDTAPPRRVRQPTPIPPQSNTPPSNPRRRRLRSGGLASPHFSPHADTPGTSPQLGPNGPTGYISGPHSPTPRLGHSPVPSPTAYTPPAQSSPPYRAPSYIGRMTMFDHRLARANAPSPSSTASTPHGLFADMTGPRCATTSPRGFGVEGSASVPSSTTASTFTPRLNCYRSNMGDSVIVEMEEGEIVEASNTLAARVLEDGEILETVDEVSASGSCGTTGPNPSQKSNRSGSSVEATETDL